MKLLFYLCSGSAFEDKHSADTNMVRTFPTSTNAKEHVLLALGSDRVGRDNVEISRCRSQSTCSFV